MTRAVFRLDVCAEAGVGWSQVWDEKASATGSSCPNSVWHNIPRILKILNRNLTSGHCEDTRVQVSRETCFIEQLVSVSYDFLIFKHVVCGLLWALAMGPSNVLAKPVA